MPADTPIDDLEIHSKLWVERAGKVALSDWRAELLLAIDETGSLSAAAERLNVPYRTAWYKLKGAEKALGISLVESESGGVAGGQTRLTKKGSYNMFAFGEGSVAMQRVLADDAGIERLIERLEEIDEEPGWHA